MEKLKSIYQGTMFLGFLFILVSFIIAISEFDKFQDSWISKYQFIFYVLELVIVFRGFYWLDTGVSEAVSLIKKLTPIKDLYFRILCMGVFGIVISLCPFLFSLAIRRSMESCTINQTFSCNVLVGSLLLIGYVTISRFRINMKMKKRTS